MDKEKIMKLCQQIGLVAMSDKKHYPALHSDFDFINNAQMDIFREVTAPPKSNADRIRQMTEEELATQLEAFICHNVEECRREDINCVECALKWLKQEVKTDDKR